MITPALAAILLAASAHGQTIQCPEGQTYRYGTCYPDKALLGNSLPPAKPAAAPPTDSPAATPPAATPPAAPAAPVAPAVETPLRLETGWVRNEASFDAGAFLPTAKITLGGKDDIASPGFAVGGRYFRDIAPNAAFGLGIEKLLPGSHDSDTLIPNGKTTTKFDSLTVMGLFRYATGDDVRFTVTGGLGFHSSTMKIDVTPSAGLVWTDTGTRESRTFVDSTKTAAALMLAGGVDGKINETFSAGGELAYYALGSADYEAAPAGKRAGLASVNGSLAGLAVSGHVSARF
jgi:opacity protein-like surface antigen